jgi:chromosome segregation ATPase
MAKKTQEEKNKIQAELEEAKALASAFQRDIDEKVKEEAKKNEAEKTKLQKEITEKNKKLLEAEKKAKEIEEKLKKTEKILSGKKDKLTKAEKDVSIIWVLIFYTICSIFS